MKRKRLARPKVKQPRKKSRLITKNRRVAQKIKGWESAKEQRKRERQQKEKQVRRQAIQRQKEIMIALAKEAGERRKREG